MSRIEGKVLSSEDDIRKPLPGVLVGILSASAQHPDLSSRTDAEGRYRLEGLDPGTYVIGAAGGAAKANVNKADEVIACDILAETDGDTTANAFQTEPTANAFETGEDDGPGEPETFLSDPNARDEVEVSDGTETEELSFIDRGLVYAVLSLKLGSGMRDRDALTDVAYQTLHPEEPIPFSTDDPDLAQKSQEWLELQREIVDPLLGNTTPSVPNATTAEAFGLEAIRVPDGVGYKVRRNGVNWAAPKVVQAIQAIGREWAKRHDEPIWILDTSLEKGGKVGRHKSHQCFHDCDVQLRIGREKLCMTKSRYPEWRTLWQELADIVRTNGVLPIKAIGFSDRNVRGVSPWAGHHCHFHVRFCAPPETIDAVEAAVAELYSDKPRNKRPNYRARRGDFEAALALPQEPELELFPIDYLDAEVQAEAAVRGLSFVQRGFAYAAIGLAFARGLRRRDALTDEGWKAVYPEAPFPLQSWHDEFAEKRQAWLDIRDMVTEFLETVQSDRRRSPSAPAVCTNAGRSELRRLAAEAERAGAPAGFATFAEGAAWTESRWNNCAVNDSASEASAALRLFEGAKGRGWFPNNPFGPDDFGFGSAGWFGLMPSTGLIAGGNRGPFIDADPRLVADPAASVVMIADFAVRVARKYRVRHWLDIRRGMASLRLIGPKADDRTRAQQAKARFEEGLERAGVANPEAFMLQEPDVSGYPGAWHLWQHLDATR